MNYKVSIFEIIKIVAILITASLAFGSAFQKIEANCNEINSLKAYYKDVSISLNKIAVDTSYIKGQLKEISRLVYK